VANEDLVDLDDARAGASIRSEQMAHIIIEYPTGTLQAAVLKQRILVCILCDLMKERGLSVRRDGDDVFLGERKLTVSIAAPSAKGCLIHLGINVDPKGSPVPAIGLGDIEIEPKQLLAELLERYASEMTSCSYAETKVRQVP
jgi:hypothetical protein